MIFFTPLTPLDTGVTDAAVSLPLAMPPIAAATVGNVGHSIIARIASTPHNVTRITPPGTALRCCCQQRAAAADYALIVAATAPLPPSPLLSIAAAAMLLRLSLRRGYATCFALHACHIRPARYFACCFHTAAIHRFFAVYAHGFCRPLPDTATMMLPP